MTLNNSRLFKTSFSRVDPVYIRCSIIKRIDVNKLKLVLVTVHTTGIPGLSYACTQGLNPVSCLMMQKGDTVLGEESGTQQDLKKMSFFLMLGMLPFTFGLCQGSVFLLCSDIKRILKVLNAVLKYNCQFLPPKTSTVGAEGTAKLVKCLPCKYKDLSLVPRIHTKMLGLIVSACYPNTEEVETIRL